MKWHFRPYAPGEKTRDPIQGEFFATEAIRNPAEALTCEARRSRRFDVRGFLCVWTWPMSEG